MKHFRGREEMLEMFVNAACPESVKVVFLGRVVIPGARYLCEFTGASTAAVKWTMTYNNGAVRITAGSIHTMPAGIYGPFNLTCEANGRPCSVVSRTISSTVISKRYVQAYKCNKLH